MSILTACVMALLVVATVILMIPRTWRVKLFGYIFLADFSSSMYILNTFASTGAISALVVAVAAMLAMTITLRVGRAFFGSERVSLNDDTSISAIVSGILTQTVMWVKSTWSSLFFGGNVKKPEPLDWKWTVELEPTDLIGGLRRLATTL